MDINDAHAEIFCLVWLDANPAETRSTEQKLRSIVNHLKKFQDVGSCQNFIEKRSKNDRLIMIVSGRLGQEIVPHIHNLRQVISIYVYCMDIERNKKWSSKFKKVKAVVTELKELVAKLKADHKIQKIVDEPFSYSTYSKGKSTAGVRGQFVFSQVLIDCLLRLPFSETDRKEFFDRCKKQYEGNSHELDNIRDFRKEYTSEKALWWYSRETFFYKTLNAILRSEDIHMIFLFRTFIYDIYRRLGSCPTKNALRVYRGQNIGSDELDTLQKNCGQFISINSFFSTSTDKHAALSFLNHTYNVDDLEKVLFVIDAVSTSQTTKPFGDISACSYFSNESEVLFMLGSIFRLNSVDRSSTDSIWIVKMTWCNENEHDLKNVLTYMKQKLGSGETNLEILGKFLSEMGKFDLAEKYFIRLLEQLPHNSPLLVTLYEDLAQVTSQKGDYDQMLQWQQKAIALKSDQSSSTSAIPMVDGPHDLSSAHEIKCRKNRIDGENCDRAAVKISFKGIDPSIIYAKLLAETLLEIDDDDRKSIKAFAEFCRLQDDIPEDQIRKVEREYSHHTPIWWYTAPYFVYAMLNRGLRSMDIDIIFKMGFFIRHLHNHIQTLYDEQQSSSSKMKGPFLVYRGQGLSLENFDKMKQTKGGLMSFNNFLSTSLNREVSLKNFARPAALREHSVGILLVITVDPQICRKSAVPYADVKDVGYYKGTEPELLFTTHTIFRIEKFQRLQDTNTDRLWEINLTLVGNDDHELSELESHLREDVGTAPGWSRLGYIFIKLGELSKAERLYKILLENATTGEDRASYNYQLGWVYDNLGEYSKAISYYTKYLEYKEKTVEPNDLSLVDSYNNIGMVHQNMGEYSKALQFFRKGIDVGKISLPPSHPQITQLKKNIENVKKKMK